jgi:hypothetical protein
MLAGPGMDIDQRGWWRKLDKLLPDEWLGGGGALAHRGITHWIAWGPLIAVAWWWALAHGPAVLGSMSWVGWGVAAGWASHSVMDALFGHAVRTLEGAIVVRRGVPTVLWYRHRFGVWTSSGPGSAFAGFVLSMVAVGQVLAMAGGGGRVVAAASTHPQVVAVVVVVMLVSTLTERRGRKRPARQTPQNQRGVVTS